MQALRASTRISPLLNSAFNRYSIQRNDHLSCDVYRSSALRKHLLIGESLGAEALEVYRNFFLYHSIAPYTIPSLDYRYGYSHGMMTGFMGLLWNFGSWFFRYARRAIGYLISFVPALSDRSIVHHGEKANESECLNEII